MIQLTYSQVVCYGLVLLIIGANIGMGIMAIMNMARDNNVPYKLEPTNRPLADSRPHSKALTASYMLDKGGITSMSNADDYKSPYKDVGMTANQQRGRIKELRELALESWRGYDKYKGIKKTKLKRKNK